MTSQIKAKLKHKGQQQFASVESREKHSVLMREVMRKPCVQARLKAANSSEEVRAKRRQVRWSPERHERGKVIQEAKWADPAFREKHSAGVSLAMQAKVPGVFVDGTVFPSAAAAAREASITVTTVLNRTKSQTAQFSGWLLLSNTSSEEAAATWEKKLQDTIVGFWVGVDSSGNRVVVTQHGKSRGILLSCRGERHAPNRGADLKSECLIVFGCAHANFVRDLPSQ